RGGGLGGAGKLVPQAVPATAGTRWQSSRGEVQVETFRFSGVGVTLASVLERLKKEPNDRKVEYQVSKPNFFVISGLQSGVKRFYVRAEVKDNDVPGVSLLYHQPMHSIIDPIPVARSNN